MASGDKESTEWSLNLDITDALDALGKFKGGLSELGSSEDLSNLISKFTEMGMILGSVGLAVLAIKESMDLVFEGENIEAVNNQFQILSENAGIAGDILKEGLQAASAGLIDDTTLLKEANKGIMELGENAKHLDEVMAVARKAAAVTGQDVSSSFEQMVQAIASGQTRQLRGMGIIIDQRKAYEDYAKSIGATVTELNKQGQQHAILNAVMEQSKNSLNGINADAKQATNAFEAFKATLTDLKELFIVSFEKTAGPTLGNFFNNLREWTGEAKTYFQANFGSGVEAANAKTKTLGSELLQLKSKLTDLQVFDKQPFLEKWFGSSKQEQIKKLQQQITVTEAELNGLHAKTAANGAAIDKKSVAENEINQEAKRKDDQKYYTELYNLQQKNLADEKKTAISIAQVDRIAEEQTLLFKKQMDLEEQKIKQRSDLDDTRRAALIVQLHKSTNLKIKALDNELETSRINSLNNYAQHTDSITKGIAASWHKMALSAEKDSKDFSKIGEASFNAFNQNAQSAFIAIGDGSKNAGDAMRGFMLNSLADIAQSQGSVLLASALLNPLNGIAGAALLTLSGVLRSLAGSSGSSGGGATTSAVTTSAGGETAFSGVTSGNAPPSPANVQTKPQNTVSLTVQGNYYDTNEAKMAMMDMIRSATDATDFNYFKVGGT